MVRELIVVIDILTCSTGGTFQRVNGTTKLVKSVTIQNLTTTASTLVTITSITGGSSNGLRGTAAKGILLNAGGSAGVAGGAVVLPVHDYTPGDFYLDLSTLAWTATNTNDQISVEYEMFGGTLQL